MCLHVCVLVCRCIQTSEGNIGEAIPLFFVFQLRSLVGLMLAEKAGQ